eukprot:jgi/Chrzof1/3956/Cz13g14240.t1
MGTSAHGHTDTGSTRGMMSTAGRATSRAGAASMAVCQEPSTSSSTSQFMSDLEKNPFNPPADEDIFRLREEEKQKALAAKTQALSMSVADKTTFSSRMQTTFGNEQIKAHFKEIVKPPQEEIPDTTLAASACPTRLRRERVNTVEFLAKKREIFLVQMSLDTKRAEIRKLEERARQRDEALKKSEAMLEDDAVRFDAFLKENDDKVQEAIKNAEVEAKAKQDKVLEIKRLNTAIAALKSELNKQEEALEDCRRYKEFLDSVTHPEWFEAQAAKQKERRAARLRQWQDECDAVKARKEAAAAAKAKAEADYSNARTQQEAERAEKAIKEAAVALKEALRAKEPPRPNVEEETDSAAADAENNAMYFVEPAQLLQVFSQLEESNLFLIQNCQVSGLGC